ncbi:MAG: hypothetical protein N3D84_02395, partial [Candidatus Woesearchaeota archaeon]|nr:hypothetical protein [Candidatus Woesearchaeota archaeon]
MLDQLNQLKFIFSAILYKIAHVPNIKYPYVLLFFIPIVIALLIIIKKDFVKFKSEDERKEYARSKRFLRIFVFISRSIIFLCILMAIATPFMMKKEAVEGDLSIVILADNSTSFEVYNSSAAQALKNNLELSFPSHLKYIAQGMRSPLADNLLSNLRGNDNILLVTDGQNNYGKSLRDVVLFAATLNSTINAIYPRAVHDDTSVVIKGVDKAVRGSELTFTAKVTQVGNEHSYHIKVTLGNKVLVDEDAKGSQTFTFGRELGEGFHKIIAEVSNIDGDDYFPDNNVYYKTIEILPRPKIFMWSKKESYFYSLMKEIFNFARESSLPDDLSEYYAVIMNDININDISSNDYQRLVDFVLNGSGLVVYGGPNSYD